MQFLKLSDCLSYYQNYHLTTHKYQWRANALRWFDAVPLSDLKKYHVKAYHQIRTASVTNATVNRELAFARAAVNCVNRDHDLSIRNPFADICFIERDHLPHYLTLEQFKALVSKAQALGYRDLSDFLTLLVMTGCRPIELYTLHWDNVTLGSRQFVVRNCWSKSRRTIYKYLNDTALAVLMAREGTKADGWVFYNRKSCDHVKSYAKIFKKVRAAAGIDCTFYDLRHTYASWLVQGSVPIYTVRDLLGHRDVTTTQRYAHLDYAQYLEALKTIG